MPRRGRSMNLEPARMAVRPGDKFDHWHQVTCRDFSRTECHRVPRRRFSAAVSIREFAALKVNHIGSSTDGGDAIRVVRTPEDIRRDPRDCFMLWLADGGDTVFRQHGRDVRMQPGDLVLHDQAQPFSLYFSGHSRAITLTIPRPLLLARLPDAAALTARSIPGDSQLGRLAGAIVRQLDQFEDGIAHRMVDRIAASALDIIATSFEARLLAGSGQDHAAERLDRVKRYILANLHEAALDLETIAAANGMSPRTLNRLFAPEGITPIRWLWRARLATAHRMLSGPRAVSVTEAALACGFSDVSHFSRVFKAAFGRAPRLLAKG